VNVLLRLSPLLACDEKVFLASRFLDFFG
jgi:hypothetical protein